MARIKVFALSTCPYCRQARHYLDENHVDYDVVEVDKLEGPTREATIEEVKRISGGTSFPVIAAGDEVVIGYDKEHIGKLAGL